MRGIYTVLLVALLLTTGNALVYGFTYDPRAQSTINVGLRDWVAPIEYDDVDRRYLNDEKREPNPVTSVNGSVSPISAHGLNLGIFSGSASASAQNLTAKLSIPAIPNAWDSNDVLNNYSALQTAAALYNDYVFYEKVNEDDPDYGQLTLHYDITGSIDFSNTSYTGPPRQILVEMFVLDPVTYENGYRTIFDSGNSTTWDGTDFYNHHNINLGFDYIVDFEFGVENELLSEFKITAKFLEAGSPGTTIDFSSTATYYAKELRDGFGSELPLIDSSGAPLLESASGTIHSAPIPIPGAVWLLGSGLIGIVGIRKKFKK